MKLLIIGDLHLRDTTPQCRTEQEFGGVCLGKLGQIARIAEREFCQSAVQVGDFCHSARPSLGLLARTISVLRGWSSGIPLRVIHGQHDLLYHSPAAADRSAIRLLEEAVEYFFALPLGHTYGGWPFIFTGAPFGSAPPPPPKDNSFKVLVAHAMVGDRPLYPGHDLTGPEEYVKRHPGYDLYCLGDYHYPFSVKVGDAWVINPGAVMRLTADERDRTRRPKVVLYNMETNEPEDVYLDVTPEAEAFDLMRKATPTREARYSDLARALRRTGGAGVSFKENLAKAFEDQDVPPPVRNRVWEAYGAAQESGA